jgi:hypothetical protein
MYCKLCNTRLDPGERTCPNCGNDAGPEVSLGNRPSRPAPLPSSGLADARDADDELDVELELDDVTGEITPPPPSTPKPSARLPSKLAAKAKAAIKSKKPTPVPAGRAPLSAPDAAGLRALLSEQPEMLEEGLEVYRNPDGKAVGTEFSTDVGDIDLLATSPQGDLVVVMISEKGRGEALVAEVLQRVGWVRKHLGEDGGKVRGIVLCEETPDNLNYAAAAVADTVRFKTFRVALTFQDLEI